MNLWNIIIDINIELYDSEYCNGSNGIVGYCWYCWYCWILLDIVGYLQCWINTKSEYVYM